MKLGVQAQELGLPTRLCEGHDHSQPRPPPLRGGGRDTEPSLVGFAGMNSQHLFLQNAHCRELVCKALAMLAYMQGLLDFFFAARANTRTPGEIGLRTCEQLVQCFGVRGAVYGEEGQGCWGFPLPLRRH